jgi:hypothetical protein
MPRFFIAPFPAGPLNSLRHSARQTFRFSLLFRFQQAMSFLLGKGSIAFVRLWSFDAIKAANHLLRVHSMDSYEPEETNEEHIGKEAECNGLCSTCLS